MYLFFVRAFNDIDHMTPVVWKMSRDNCPVAVYCISPDYDIDNDYRLNFLKDLGVKVDFIYNDFDHELGLLHRLSRFLFLKSFAIGRKWNSVAQTSLVAFRKIFGQLAQQTGSRLFKLTRKRFYGRNWARRILEQSGAQALCFDHVQPTQYIVSSLLRAAEEMSVATLALPHGIYLYTNDLVKAGSTADTRYDKFHRYDYIVVQNKLRKEVLTGFGVEGEKIFVLGSARYCDEWMSQYSEIIPRMLKSDRGSGEKLKVVFMTTRPEYRIDVQRMLSTFDMLSELDGIEVVVKPHTRTGREAHIYDNSPLANVSDISSVELSEWADVMLVIGSSIIIEALTRGKPALYLKYLHENTTDYEEFEACWIINDETELQDALQFLRDREGRVPYSEDNVNRWLAEIIYGGRGVRDVLSDYEKFIVDSTR
jgi:hypothetical protein